MNWKFWEWGKTRERKPSPATIEAKQETVQAQERLRAVEKDDVKLNQLTARTQRLARENGFGADIRKALGAR